MNRQSPKSYGSFADFEREELRPMNKLGFCVDDLEVDVAFRHSDEGIADAQSAELDFG